MLDTLSRCVTVSFFTHQDLGGDFSDSINKELEGGD